MDYQAYARFYGMYAPTIYGIIVKCTVDKALAADILEDVFVCCYQQGEFATGNLSLHQLLKLTFQGLANKLTNKDVLAIFKIYKRSMG